MSSNIDALQLRRSWGRGEWLVPEPFGSDGWRMIARDGSASIIATCADFDGADWIHASIGRRHVDPSYEDLARLYQSVWNGRGEAYQVFVPPNGHINIHEHTLHLWGRLDGKALLPDFGFAGTI